MKVRMTPTVQESIRCGASSCSCAGFEPGKVLLRSCDRCGHGWVEHALGKFQARPASGCGPVEVVHPGLVFDLSSLVLFGAQAVPVQLKILLDRLYSVLTLEQVGQILNGLGWSLGDYVRGYMLQHPSGKVLDRWFMATPEEELLVLKQFLRFGETRPIVELMMLRYLGGENLDSEAPVKNVHSDVLTNKGASLLKRSLVREEPLVDGKDAPDSRENNQRGYFPFHFPQSAIYCSSKDTGPSTGLQNILQGFGGNTLDQKHESYRHEEHDDLVLKRSEREPASSKPIKADMSEPSLWHHHPVFHHDQVLLQTRRIQQEKTTPLPSSFNFSFSSSSSLCPPILPSSHLHPQKSQTLPSFSSSFLRPLHSASSSPLHPLTAPCSSLHALPSSLCAFPYLPATGGRKGRVSCGVCGKSFYDKGTLKIHYNAVHLKIKHRCTVMGCTMVFSSLRSRNRHSANPNPRLHTGGGREAQPYRSAAYGRGSVHTGTPVHEVEPDTQTLVQATGSKSDINGHKAASPDPPLMPAAPISGGFPSPCTRQQWWRPLPKKKPRKSSMPVKIERETDKSRKHKDES